MAFVPAIYIALEITELIVKRILTLDGGGIRGVFSLQILDAIEAMFRQDQKRPDLVLADVFDFFAGTSTGAIIAACLSWGMSISEIEALYLHCANEIFSKEHWYRRWKTKYRAEPIAALFRNKFCEDVEGGTPALLGSKRLRTLLLIMMRNASTGSPWPITNNPHASFNDSSLPDCNLNIPLWQVVRASTAAPMYFPPEEISLGGRDFLFVDGGMTPFNNPALISVLMATLPQYKVCWPAGRENLHLVSIGTCATRAKLPHKTATEVNLLDSVRYLAPAWIGAIAVEQDFICRILGDCVNGFPIDSEVKTLDTPSLFPANEQKFTYVRYDESFEAAQAEAQLLSKAEAEMDDLTMVPLLQKMGKTYVEKHVRFEHLFPRKP